MRKILVFILIAMLVAVTITACDQKEKQVQKQYDIISEDIIVGEGTEWALPGMLTLPKDAKGKIPAVVLVHGSGPSNMDGTSSVHAYAPYKDIAEYLASQGIAVLRHDKSTFTHNSKFVDDFTDITARNFTIKEESVDSAILAGNILKNDERIDSEKVYVLGLSLGGMIAPRIDKEGGNFAGLIIMAGSPRKFSEIWYDQNKIAIKESNLTDDAKEAQRKQLEEYMGYFRSFKDMTDDEAKQYVLVGCTGYYFKDLDAYPSNEYLKNTEKPVLIMQGGKDFQVFADIDYEQYQNLLQGKDNVTFKLYPELNHFFITSRTGTIDEYKVRDKVNSEPLQDIVEWINAN